MNAGTFSTFQNFSEGNFTNESCVASSGGLFKMLIALSHPLSFRVSKLELGLKYSLNITDDAGHDLCYTGRTTGLPHEFSLTLFQALLSP